MKFDYPGEKLSAARKSLMLPHPKGEAVSIMNALHECYLGLEGLDIEEVDSEDAKFWIRKIREFVDTAGVHDPTGRGAWLVKAENLSETEKFELSRIVNELASWFNMVFWSSR